MGEYKLKTGRIGKKFTKIFLEKNEENENGYSLKAADKMVSVYQKIEGTVVGSYNKIENAFVDAFLEKAADESEGGKKEQVKKYDENK